MGKATHGHSLTATSSAPDLRLALIWPGEKPLDPEGEERSKPTWPLLIVSYSCRTIGLTTLPDFPVESNDDGIGRPGNMRATMTTLTRSIFVSLAIVLVAPRFAAAGMPSVTLADLSREVSRMTRTGLTDLARQRLEVISFFLLGLLACAGVIRWVWNGLRKDFPILPRLSFARSLGIIVLWGLLFVLVLTMISGARELMTPGAWEKKGLTYRLVQPKPPPVEAEIRARYETISRMGAYLIGYARVHDGAFPTVEGAGEIPEALWRVPSPGGGRYVYVGGRMADDEAGRWRSPLAFEPESVGPDRLVLMTNGMVQWMPATEIERVLSSKEP